MKLLFLDTETTGFQDPRIVELAYSIEGESVISQGFFCPPKEIELMAMQMHGYTNEYIRRFPSFEYSPDKEKLQTLLDTHIVVTHNLPFDKRVLENEGLVVKQGLCTQSLSRQVWPSFSCHKLQFLRYRLGLDVPGQAHSAMGDVLVLRELMTYIVRQLSITPDAELKLDEVINGSIQRF